MRHAMPVRHGALVRPRDAGSSPFMTWVRFCVAGRRRCSCICWMALSSSFQTNPWHGLRRSSLLARSLAYFTYEYVCCGFFRLANAIYAPRHCFRLSGGPRQRRSPPMDRYLGTRRYLREIIRVTKPPSHWPRLSFKQAKDTQGH
jgi:hypothetical protein